MSLDPTQPPPRNVALTLAQAALQRQTQLLEALSGHAAAKETGEVTSNPGDSTGPSPAMGAGTDTTLPNETGTSHRRDSASSSVPVRLSDPARAQLAQAESAALPLTAPTSPSKSTGLAPTVWPVTVPDEPTLALLDALLQDTPASGVAGAKLLGVLPWPPALVQQLIKAGTDSSDKAQPTAWQTWPLPASVLQTAVGRQTLQATLMLPTQGHLEPNDPATAGPFNPTAMAATPRLLLMPQQTTPLASAWFALLLETEAGEHRNALLALELGAPQATTVYGRDLFTPRSDPWQQQAMLLASGQLPRVAARQGENALPTCQTTDCPYHGRAACPQPFCPDALRIQPLR